MNKDLEVSQSVDINAEPLKVWQALTTPEIIKVYLFGTNTVTDWKPGSEIIFQGDFDGQTYRDHGVILENNELEKLSYSYWSGFSGLEDKPENYSTVTYTLKKVDDKTTNFTWTQIGYANEEGQQHSKNGMEDFLNQIKTIVER
jgi:uncharacterized protein YndB with AHSA1/START domain